MSAKEWVGMAVVSISLVVASLFQWWSVSLVETLGFVFGGICVWLVVREHSANWPVGIANNIAFGVLFWNSRLFADMGLQVVYAIIAIYGWRNWSHGRSQHSPLRITHAHGWEWSLLALAVPTATWFMYSLLVAADGAAPFWDALTTAMSLAAQYLLARKRIENWWIWIGVDIIYIPLYISRSLPLTAVLYAVFLVMCLIGLSQWTKRIRAVELPAGVEQ